MPNPEDDERGEGVIRAVHRVERAELRSDIDRLERRVDGQGDQIAVLREGHARIDGEVKHLVRAYERAATVATNQVLTDLEVRKADALAQIKDRAADRRQHRVIAKELIFKGIAIVMGLGTVLYGLLSSRC